MLPMSILIHHSVRMLTVLTEVVGGDISFLLSLKEDSNTFPYLLYPFRLLVVQCFIVIECSWIRTIQVYVYIRVRDREELSGSDNQGPLFPLPYGGGRKKTLLSSTESGQMGTHD